MKKKIVSMLLALTLVVTGIPSGMTVRTVNAAELSEESAVITEETKEADDVAESSEEAQETLHSAAGDLYTFNVSQSGKAVGSDGVVYEDVVYLSAENVKALNADARDAYFAFCDEIASAFSKGDILEDVVAAVDEDGTLACHYSIPVKALETGMGKLAEDFIESVQTEEIAQETQGDETAASQAEALEDKSEAEETVDVEDSIEKASAEESLEETAEETVTEETTADDSTEEDTATQEETTVEETVSDTDAQESAVESEMESQSSDETVIDETSAEETQTDMEEESESETEDTLLSEENMELIPELEEEYFPVIENVKADIIVDLGYDSAEIQEIKSILPSKDWFSSQLTKNQQTIYKACGAMGKGTNKFKFNATSKLTLDDFKQAISAYILTEPYKCDWMDLSSQGKLDIVYYYYSKSDPTYEWEVNIGKSEFYNASLNKAAEAKILELAAQAQEYAIQNYPNAPVYGIVKYFDKWICENNYYNMVGVTGGSSSDKSTREIYYYSHSSYGILLKGYGVCESYALSMTRLLDSIGIPNMYATGLVPADTESGFGGHAWNYVQMPDRNWYLHDSTWNDDEKLGGSTEDYLLCADDGYHFPVGNRYNSFTEIFDFVTPSATGYKPAVESIKLSQTEINLLPKKTAELTYDNAYISNENVTKTWLSSDEKVAKVDKNGKITAVAPGQAKITLTAAGMTETCVVNVHQINSLLFEDSGKASLTTSGGIVSGSSKKETQHVYLTVKQKAENPVYTAEELYQKGIFDDFAIVSSNTSVAEISTTVTGNKIDLAITPAAVGKTKVTVTFGTKKATLNYSVGEMLDEKWFDLKEVDALVKDGNEGKLMYTGKAYKPKVVLSSEGKAKKVKFKVSYFNNKDAGTASVVIAGTGTFGGELKKEFIISPLELKVDTSAIKVSPKNLYNGGVNQTKSTVKHIDNSGKKPKKVGLKAGKDYDIKYTNKVTKETTTNPTEAGEYTMEIVGKGNYSGGDNKPVAIEGATWKIEPNDIKKVKVTVKVNGTTPVVTVAIGKNMLPETDYKMTFYKDKECKTQVNKDILAAKTQYFVKVEAAGANLTDLKNKPIVKSFKTK